MNEYEGFKVWVDAERVKRRRSFRIRLGLLVFVSALLSLALGTLIGGPP